MGQPISLELHHINGIHSDLRIENLQILCPNCHALTENYRGKKLKSECSKEQIITETHPRKRLKKYYISPEIQSKNLNEEEYPQYKLRVCPTCGKIFYLEKHKEKKFCSYECAHKSYSQKPSKEQLLKDIEEVGLNQTLIGRKYNKSANAVKKWLKFYDLYQKDFYINQVQKPILQYDLEGNFIKEYKSISEAKRICGGINIGAALQQGHTAGGFKWKYKE